MYASVGMIYPVWAPLQSHTPGSMPTYGTGRVLQEARNATVNKEYANNPLYGDDEIVDDDNSLTGLGIDFESTGLSNADRVAVLAEEANANTVTGGQWVSDGATPYGGFGYVEKMRDKGVVYYDAWFTLKIKFQENTRQTQTREGQITWGTPKLNGRAASLDVDGGPKNRWQLHRQFETASAAKAWLNTMANISAATT